MEPTRQEMGLLEVCIGLEAGVSALEVLVEVVVEGRWFGMAATASIGWTPC